MNTRIKELAEQAGFYADKYGHCLCHIGDHFMDGNDSVDLEKFAKLIIEECADFCVQHDAFEISDDINEYFGVD